MAEAPTDARCRETRDRIHPYLTGRLAPDERERYAAHAADCPDCRRYVEQMDAAIHLRCDALVELVTDYLEDRLSAAERARFEAHLVLCRGCRAYLEQMRATIRLTGTLTAESLAPEARYALLDAFRTWQRR